MHLEPNGAITPPSSYTETDATQHTADSHATAPAPPGADVGEFDRNLPAAGNVDETLRGLATDLGGHSSGSLLQGAGAQATPSGSSGASQPTLGAEAAAGELAPNPQSGQAKRKRDDPDYDPNGNLARLQKRSREEKVEGGNYPLEQRSGEAAKKGTELEVQLPSGRMASNIGRGDAPFISSNQGDYKGAAVEPTYNHMATVLDRGGRKRQGQLAEAGLKMARNDEESVSTREGLTKKGKKKEIKTVEYSGLELGNIVPNITPQEKRGLGQLVAITHLAEQHTNRTPGSGTLARASLTKIAEGHSTFKKEFNSKDGNYTPALLAAKKGGIGGTQMMKDMVEGKTKYQGAEDTAAYMSESDEDPGQLLADDMSGSDSENDYVHRTTAKRESGVSGNSDQWDKSGADMAKFKAAEANGGELVSDSGSVSAEETGSEEESGSEEE